MLQKWIVGAIFQQPRDILPTKASPYISLRALWQKFASIKPISSLH